MDDAKVAHRIRGKVEEFSGKVSRGLPKPACRLVRFRGGRSSVPRLRSSAVSRRSQGIWVQTPDAAANDRGPVLAAQDAMVMQFGIGIGHG